MYVYVHICMYIYIIIVCVCVCVCVCVIWLPSPFVSTHKCMHSRKRRHAQTIIHSPPPPPPLSHTARNCEDSQPTLNIVLAGRSLCQRTSGRYARFNVPSKDSWFKLEAEGESPRTRENKHTHAHNCARAHTHTQFSCSLKN